MNLADAIGWAGTAFCLPAFYLVLSSVFHPNPERAHIGNGLYAIGNWLSFLAKVMDTSPGWAAFFGLLATWFTWLWWKNRRKGRGRKALRELGAKSRARVQALVDQMTPSPIPSPAGASS